MLYVHPEARFVKTINNDYFYSCDPIGFPNYMVSRSGILINITTGKETKPYPVVLPSGKKVYKINLRKYPYRKTFYMARILGIMFLPPEVDKDMKRICTSDSGDYHLDNLKWGKYSGDLGLNSKCF